MNLQVIKTQLDIMRSETGRMNRLTIDQESALKFLDAVEKLAAENVELQKDRKSLDASQGEYEAKMRSWVNTLNEEAGGLDDMEYDTAFDYLSRFAIECATEVDARDATITKLLALLKPIPEPTRETEIIQAQWRNQSYLYARACDISGRAE